MALCIQGLASEPLAACALWDCQHSLIGPVRLGGSPFPTLPSLSFPIACKPSVSSDLHHRTQALLSGKSGISHQSGRFLVLFPTSPCRPPYPQPAPSCTLSQSYTPSSCCVYIRSWRVDTKTVFLEECFSTLPGGDTRALSSMGQGQSWLPCDLFIHTVTCLIPSFIHPGHLQKPGVDRTNVTMSSYCCN